MAILAGELRDQDNIVDFLMSQPNVMPRLNDRVLSTTTKYLDMTGVADVDKDVETLSTRDLVARFCTSAKYVSSTNSAKALIPVTVWLVMDITDSAGRQLVLNALEYVDNSRLLRLGFVHNTKATLSDGEANYVDIVDAALLSNDVKLLRKLMKEANAVALIGGSKTAQDFDVDVQKSCHLELHRLLSSRVLQFVAGQRGLVVSGRVIGKRRTVDWISFQSNCNLFVFSYWDRTFGGWRRFHPG